MLAMAGHETPSVTDRWNLLLQAHPPCVFHLLLIPGLVEGNECHPRHGHWLTWLFLLTLSHFHCDIPDQGRTNSNCSSPQVSLLSHHHSVEELPKTKTFQFQLHQLEGRGEHSQCLEDKISLSKEIDCLTGLVTNEPLVFCLHDCDITGWTSMHGIAEWIL